MPKIRKLEDPFRYLWKRKSGHRRRSARIPCGNEITGTTAGEEGDLESPRKGEKRNRARCLEIDRRPSRSASRPRFRPRERWDDLNSHQKTIRQLTQDNQELRHQLEVMSKEYQRVKEVQSESNYLQEENADALERIKEFQLELKEMRER